MAGYRIPGPTGAAPESQPAIDHGTLARTASSLPGPPGGASVSAGESLGWLREVRTGAGWADLSSAGRRLLGGPGFGLGVAVGIGENLVASAVELADLVRLLILADVHDAARGTLRTLEAIPAASLRAAAHSIVASPAFHALEEAQADRL